MADVERGIGGTERRPDLSGFVTPSRDTVVEGATAEVAVVTASVDPLSPTAVSRDHLTFSGVWRSGVLAGEGRIRLGAGSLVTLNPGWVPDGSGNATRFSVQGRCLAADADRMRVLVDATLAAHVRAMRDGYVRLERLLGMTGEDGMVGRDGAQRDRDARPDGFVGPHHDLEVALPPGRYWIGDPRMAMSDLDYDRFRAAMAGSRAVDLDGRVVCASPTNHGDGTFHSDHGDVTVESGLIGIVPASLTRDDKEPTRWGFYVDAPDGILVGLDAGRHLFGIVRPGGEPEWIDVVDDPGLLEVGYGEHDAD